MKTFLDVQKLKKIITNLTPLQGSHSQIKENDTYSKSELAQWNEEH